ncbi:YncE family protein [Sutcliffiella rhizosphaerae]|uniref:YncE family protein n=1 Tax=Sutcliffiella rhizosphaerae TaxID=2880967 RepID=A0ABN8A6L5_9BACI|nr:YncE family protein [Sutcliffiella rhizosphaerae]CAG9620685.1 hypothetical protein BACCIP111883_01454 [Sutcliffiella rhizosphaerae]
MKKIIVFLVVVLTFSGCNNNEIQLPTTNNLDSTIYITHLKENAITAMDISTGKQEKVSLPFTFSSIVEISSGFFIASVKEEEKLYKINVEEKIISPFLNVGNGIVDLLYDSQEKSLYAANVISNTIQVIDVQSEKQVNDIKVGEYPSKMLLNGQQLFVLSAGSSEVYKIDTTSNNITDSINVNPRPEGLQFDGKYLWTGGHGATGSLNDRIFGYDPETKKEEISVQTGLMPIQILQEDEGSDIFVLSHGDHSLSKLDPDTYSVEQKIFVGDNPSNMIVDKNNLYITCLDGDELAIIDKNTLEVQNVFVIENGPFLLFKGGNER